MKWHYGRTGEISKRNGIIVGGPWESSGYMGAEGCCQFPAVGGNLGRERDIKGESAGSWLMMSAQSSFLSLLRMPEHLHTCQCPKLDFKG